MATDLDLEYSYKTRPSSLLNSVFMSTVNMAAKMLVSVASTSKTENSEKWKTSDHLRFMVMLMTWFTVWVLRVLMDHFPCAVTYPHYLLGGLSPVIGSLDLQPSSSTSTALPSTGSSLDLIFHEDVDRMSVKALSRALSHVLAILNDIPAASRKYQFAMAMADRIMEENARAGHVELLHVNRTALAASFSRTLSLLYRYLQRTQSVDEYSSSWPTNVVKALPLGSYISSYVKGVSLCFKTLMSWVDAGTWLSQKGTVRGGAGEGDGGDYLGDLMAEKLAHELLWVTNKLRVYGAAEEALEQWSLASGLASLSLTVSPRVQGSIVKISAVVFRELSGENIEVPTQVKFRLLVLWLPLLCHANNGLAYPVLSSFEKAEVEKAIDELLSTLPAMEQELILTNWLQDFAVSGSDWPNLQSSYDRWCQSTRQLVA